MKYVHESNVYMLEDKNSLLSWTIVEYIQLLSVLLGKIVLNSIYHRAKFIIWF
jgi:hypothetical protein